MVWMYSKKPIKFQMLEREKLLAIMEEEISKTNKIKKMASRVDVRAGRVYIYEQYEPPQIEGVVYTKPLLEGKYLEAPYLRITIYNHDYSDCALDYQRYNDQWMTLFSGTLSECVKEAEESEWFE